MIWRITFILFTVLLLGSLAFVGVFSSLLLPFQPLEDKVRLLSYVNYIALIIGPLLLVGLMLTVIHQLFHLKEINRYKKHYQNSGGKIAWLSLVIAIISVFPRFYLGYKVDQAGYVKCVNESRTSAKSSWRVYAKSDSLCKNSSGVYGG